MGRLGRHGIGSLSVIIVARPRNSRVNNVTRLFGSFGVGRVCSGNRDTGATVCHGCLGGVGTGGVTCGILGGNSAFALNSSIGFAILSPTGPFAGRGARNISRDNLAGGGSVIYGVACNRFSVVFANSTRGRTRSRVLGTCGPTSLGSSILGINRRNDGASSSSTFIGTVTPGTTAVSYTTNGRCGFPRRPALGALRGCGIRICHASHGNAVAVAASNSSCDVTGRR